MCNIRSSEGSTGQPARYVDVTSAAVIADTVPTKAGWVVDVDTGGREVVVSGACAGGGGCGSVVDVAPASARFPKVFVPPPPRPEAEHEARITQGNRVTSPNTQPARLGRDTSFEDSAVRRLAHFEEDA
jgi:hypothetical protein